MNNEKINLSVDGVLDDARININSMVNDIFDIINIGKPNSLDYAIFMSHIESKISSIVGNMIEYSMANHLNKNSSFREFGIWKRQDPEFPDNIFQSRYLSEFPGIEVKAWYPLATEITARFKPSQSILSDTNPLLALVAWLPEYILHGKPKIIGVKIIPAMQLAQSRDNHYFNPPSYLVVEPEDTVNRTQNLQQRNVNGFKSQDWTDEERNKAEEFLRKLDFSNHQYGINDTVRQLTNYLMHNFRYREETNFAKINRIKNPSVIEFKSEIMNKKIFNHPISYWSHISKDRAVVEEYYNHIVKGNSKF
jgi:hypothetical protein